MTQAQQEGRRVRESASELEDQTKDTAKSGAEKGGGAISELRGVMSEAAVAVLAPVAKNLATNAAKMAVKKGPGLLEDKVLPKLQDTVLPKLQDTGARLGIGGDDGEDGEDGDGKKPGDGTGRGRRMPIQQSVDVAAPIEVVYDQFTQFEDFPRFMHRVERAEQRDDSHVVFHEKIWGLRRMWEAEIVEQRPDERIAWTTNSGTQHVGVVTFHKLADRLTRVELNVDLDPQGPIEKIARGARFAKRAARADMKRFKAFVEMREEETGAWRGVIEEGDVVEEDVGYDDDEQEEPQAREDEDTFEDEPEAREDEEDLEDEPEASEDEDEEDLEDEPEASEDEDEEDLEDEPEAREDEDEDDEAVADEDDEDEEDQRATSRRKANGGRRRAKTAAQPSRAKSTSRATKSTSGRAKSASSSAKSTGGRAKSTGGRAKAASGSGRSRASSKTSSSSPSKRTKRR